MFLLNFIFVLFIGGFCVYYIIQYWNRNIDSENGFSSFVVCIITLLILIPYSSHFFLDLLPSNIITEQVEVVDKYKNYGRKGNHTYYISTLSNGDFKISSEDYHTLSIPSKYKITYYKHTRILKSFSIINPDFPFQEYDLNQSFNN